jgi:hypothetical protein
MGYTGDIVIIVSSSCGRACCVFYEFVLIYLSTSVIIFFCPGVPVVVFSLRQSFVLQI